MTALGPAGTEHLLTGAAASAVGVVASLLAPATRRWWPTIGAVVALLVALSEDAAPLLPSRAGLLLATAATAAALVWSVRRFTGEGGSIGRCRRTGGALVLLSALGVAAAVPDTEAALRTLGAVAVLAAVTWLLRSTPADAWIAPWLLVLWAASIGSVGRPAAFAGTLACFGIVLAAPLALLRRPAGLLLAVPAVLLLVTQAGVAAAGGRGTGLGDEVAVAAAGALGLLAVQAAVVAAAVWWHQHRARRAERVGQA